MDGTIIDDFICIDLLGFRAKHGVFVCKEFCLIEKEYVFHTLIKNPSVFPKLNSLYQCHVDYNIKHGHRLSFECGDMPISELVCKIFPKIQNKVVLVEHFVKARFLDYIFRKHSNIKCVTLDQIGCSISAIKPFSYELCDYHNRVYGWDRDGPCALTTAFKLRDAAKNANEKEV